LVCELVAVEGSAGEDGVDRAGRFDAGGSAKEPYEEKAPEPIRRVDGALILLLLRLHCPEDGSFRPDDVVEDIESAPLAGRTELQLGFAPRGSGCQMGLFQDFELGKSWLQNRLHERSLRSGSG
jgi:hypothetical protein